MKSRIKKSVIIFSVVAVLSGWIGLLVENLLSKHLEKGSSPGMGLWLLLPMLSGILISIFMKGGWKSLGIKPNFKGNIKWYIISFLIFPIITAIVLAIGSIFGWVHVSKFELSTLAFAFAGTFAGNFIKNIFEELAWRGFLTERLIKLNLSDIKIYSIVTAVWAAWHIPYYLFFLSSDYIQGSRIEALVSIFVVIVCWIVMFTEIYRLTRSIWPCVILHAAQNSLLVISQYISISKGKELFAAYDTGLISLALCICVGIFIRVYRKRQLGSGVMAQSI